MCLFFNTFTITGYKFLMFSYVQFHFILWIQNYYSNYSSYDQNQHIPMFLRTYMYKDLYCMLYSVVCCNKIILSPDYFNIHYFHLTILWKRFKLALALTFLKKKIFKGLKRNIYSIKMYKIFSGDNVLVFACEDSSKCEPGL